MAAGDQGAAEDEVGHPDVIPSWIRLAACRDLPTEMFYEKDNYADAQAVCYGCEAVDECLTLAMRNEGSTAASRRFGVFGALTPADRAKLAVAQGITRRTPAFRANAR